MGYEMKRNVLNTSSFQVVMGFFISEGGENSSSVEGIDVKSQIRFMRGVQICLKKNKKC